MKGRRMGSARLTLASAGPVLIALCVLVIMHGFWFHARLTSQQVDLLSFWLPRWCAMGKAVAAGHIPTWLPNQFGGVPFASDPQSGWLYAPVLALFGALPCARAFGLFIVLQPILAGLGMFFFFRHEGTGRAAATAGGLTLALAIAGSQVALSMPFSGTLAWTTITLAAVSGYLHAERAAARVAWLVFTGFAWSQIAAAHLTDGLLIGTMTIALYVVARLITQVRSGERSLAVAGAHMAALAVTPPLLGAAMLIPRLALLPRTSIGQGYVTLGALTQQLSKLSGVPAAALYPLNVHGTGPWWGTAFARAPGGYVGALAILVLPLAFSVRRWRLASLSFAVVGFVGWTLNQDRLIAAGPIRRFAIGHGLGELWLRAPYRFRYLLLLSFAALAGYGLQSWLDMTSAEDRRALLRRAGWFAPGLIMFVLVPMVGGAHPSSYVAFGLGACASIPLLLLAAKGRQWVVPLMVAMLAVELTIAGLVGQGGPIPAPNKDEPQTFRSSGLGHAFPTYHTPWIAPSQATTPGPIGRALVSAAPDGGRYVSYSPHFSRTSPRGFLLHQVAGVFPSYANGRATLLGLFDIQGYSPVQLLRYWKLVRRVDTYSPIFYNSATFQSIPEEVLKVFGDEWIVQGSALEPPPNSTLTTREGNWSLYQYQAREPRTSVVFDWRVMGENEALDAVLVTGFTPSNQAVVERSPSLKGRLLSPLAGNGSTSVGPVASTTYRELSSQHDQVRVTTAVPGLLVIRNPWDENWHATIDGVPAPLQVTDYMMQGLAIPAGSHVVDLRYRDTAIGTGLVVSGLGYALMSIVFLFSWLRPRRAPPQGIDGAPPAAPPQA